MVPCFPGGSWISVYPWEAMNRFLGFLCLMSLLNCLSQSMSSLAFTLPIFSSIFLVGKQANSCVVLDYWLGIKHGSPHKNVISILQVFRTFILVPCPLYQSIAIVGALLPPLGQVITGVPGVPQRGLYSMLITQFWSQTHNIAP